MSEQEQLVKPDQMAMQLALDLWVRRLQRVCDTESQRALEGHEPNSVAVIAPTQADAAHIATVLEKARCEGREDVFKRAWAIAERYTQYGVLPQKSKERKVADAIYDEIRTIKHGAISK